jgi:cysteinyl-tRNA synthetase
MTFYFYNTLTGKKEPLSIPENKKIKMYCCGVTPYSNTHIGHSRTFFSYDLLFRILRDKGCDVDWARNITDVDDKIMKKAHEEGISCADLVARYVSEQDEMLSTFCLHRPGHEPRVTEHIPQIIDLIGRLIKNDFAYVSTSGVYYRVRKFSEYGKLSKNKIDDLVKGARIEVDESKEDSLDFALWKFAKPGELLWASPWGDGRPGWHIECSAMVHSLFGDSIDIHMGGRDLIFPHHEAEIAQSEAATGKLFSKFWLHAGMVTLYGEKMSKSTNHYVSIKEFLSKYPPEVLRLVFLSVAYAQPFDFTFEVVTENLKKLSRIYRFVALIDHYIENLPSARNEISRPFYAVSIFESLPQLIPRMRGFLADDLNSAGALAAFFEFMKHININLAKLEKQNAVLLKEDILILKEQWPVFKQWMRTSLGLLEDEPGVFFERLRALQLTKEISIQEIELKIKERAVAREQKNWALSDQIRDELLAAGIQIQDAPSGTKWTVFI